MIKVTTVTEEIDNACVKIAAAGFGQDENNQAFCQDVREHVRAGELYLGYESGRAVAFRILIEKLEGVVYLAGAAKIPGSRKHLVREMTGKILEEKKPQTIITRTGNDHVVEEMLYLARNLIPFNEEIRQESLEVVERCGLVSPGLRPETLVIPEYYGGSPMLNPNLGRPRSANKEVAEFMRRVMPDEEYFKGAAILLIGEGRR